MNKTKLIAITLSIAFILSLSGCANKKSDILWYDYDTKRNMIESGTVSENSKYSLNWDNEMGCVTLFDKEHNLSYSNCPQGADKYTNQPNVYSPIVVRYIESETLNTNNVSAYQHSIKSKDFSVERLDNGITVTYFFEKVAISVPVTYVLREDSLQVSIDPSKIAEDTKYCYSIDLMPFCCSVLNTDNSGNSYLFVPSGSGALVYPKVLGESITSIISNEVYGKDDVVQDDSPTEVESIKLPVYGSKNGDSAVCAIIESADELATITTNVGSSTFGYSAVYSSFCIRGAEVYNATIMGSVASKKTLFCKEKTSKIISVAFYPLYGDEADYIGMSKVYQKYLVKNEMMVKKDTDTLLNINYIGGVMTKDFVLGIPKDELSVLTSFSDIKDSITDIRNNYSGKINLKLTGFGATGCEIGKIGGAFKYNGSFGKITEIKDLCKDNTVNIFFNYDILHFSKSGCGASTFNTVALSAISAKKPKRHYTIALHENDWLGDEYWVVSREKLNSYADKAINSTLKWRLNGVSFDTLTYRTYSDYSSNKYYAKSNYSNQVSAIADQVRASGLMFASTSGNAFAVAVSDHVFSSPTRSSGYNVFDIDVPFYQLVFKGYTSLSINPLNLSSDRKTAFLKAVEIGAGLEYTLIGSHSTDVFFTNQNAFYASQYDDNKDNIKKELGEYEKLYNDISNTTIIDFEIKNSLHITTFENGIRVYTNFGTQDVETEFGKLGSKSFVFGEVKDFES